MEVKLTDKVFFLNCQWKAFLLRVVELLHLLREAHPIEAEAASGEQGEEIPGGDHKIFQNDWKVLRNLQFRAPSEDQPAVEDQKISQEILLESPFGTNQGHNAFPE